MARNQARNMVKTAARRGYKSLLHEWDESPDWANSMLKVGWRRDDMIYCMELADTLGKDPEYHKLRWNQRQQRASTTKVLRFQPDKEFEPLSTPCPPNITIVPPDGG